jgi:hypothetical protein
VINHYEEIFPLPFLCPFLLQAEPAMRHLS